MMDDQQARSDSMNCSRPRIGISGTWAGLYTRRSHLRARHGRCSCLYGPRHHNHSRPASSRGTSPFLRSIFPLIRAEDFGNAERAAWPPRRGLRQRHGSACLLRGTAEGSVEAATPERKHGKGLTGTRTVDSIAGGLESKLWLGLGSRALRPPDRASADGQV